MPVVSKHRKELEKSAIAPDIASINFHSLEGAAALDAIIGPLPNSERRNDGRVRSKYLKKYAHTEKGGFWFSGVDPLSGEEMLWGCFKPDKPRSYNDHGKHKKIKYEHPPKIPTRIFCPKVSLEIWEMISARCNISLPKEIKVTEEGQALGFWPWVIKNAVPITITEGAKKTCCLISQGYAAIGLPGIYNGYRTPKDEYGSKIGKPALIPDLAIFTTKGRKIYFAFDEDSKSKTINNVAIATYKTGKLLEREGCEVSVIRWNGELGKGCDDFIYSQGVEFFEGVVDDAESLHAFWLRHQKRLSEIPDKTIALTDESPYIGKLPDFGRNQLILLRAPKGAGKTEAIAEAIAQHQYKGGKTISLTHRRTLNNEQAKRFSLMNMNDREADEFEGVFGIILCKDSLLKVARGEEDIESLHGAWLLLDEADQSLWHLLNANTEVSKKRPAILQRLREIVEYIIATRGKIILASADLNDITVAFYKKLIGHRVETLAIVTDDQRIKKTKLYNYTETNPGHLVADLEKHILNGGRAFICLSGQKTRSTWGTQTLEAHLLKLNPRRSDGTPLRILRIDQETLADPNHPAYGCTDSLNELLLYYDIVIVSPTIETGVSIDIKGHFDSVWAIAYGIQTENSVRQSLRRVRENVPRYLWCAKTGTKTIGNGATSPQALYASQQNQTKQHLALLAQAGAFFEDEQLTEVCPAALQAWCQMAALINLEMKTYRESVLAGIIGEGYLVQDVGKDDDVAKDKKQDIKVIRDKNYKAYCKAVSEAEDKSEEEIAAMQEKKTRTPEESRQIRKGIIKSKYSLKVTPSLVERDDGGLHGMWRLDYHLKVGREHLPHRGRRNAQTQIFAGQYFSPDLNKGQKWGKVLGLEEVGFVKLRFANQKEHRNDDPDLIKLQGICIEKRQAIKEWLGITINPQSSPVTIFKQLLKLVGLDIPFLKKEGPRGKQVRIYGQIMPDWERDDKGKPILDRAGHAIPIWDEREEVWQTWLTQDEERLKKEQEEIAEQQSQRLVDRFVAAIRSGNVEAMVKGLSSVGINSRYFLIYQELEEYLEEAEVFFSEYYDQPQIARLLIPEIDDAVKILERCNSSEALKKVLYFNGRLTRFTKKILNQAYRLLNNFKQTLVRQWIAEIKMYG